MVMMQTASLVIFLLALLITGVVGTETRPLFFWPGAALPIAFVTVVALLWAAFRLPTMVLAIELVVMAGAVLRDTRVPARTLLV